MAIKKEGNWIYHDKLVRAGLTFEDVAILYTLRGLSEPTGFIETKMMLEAAYPDSAAQIERLEKIIREGKISKKVRILPNGSWWFADRCAEKLGEHFNPYLKMHRQILTELIRVGIPLSDVPDVYWSELDKVPIEQLQKLSYDELMELAGRKTPFINS